MRRLIMLVATGMAMLVGASPALACGGLVAPNGSVNLLKTTTLAAYHDGIEHYVTSFQFDGGRSGEFGSIVPLPGIPEKVQRGGRWTLQRLVEEVQPRTLALAAQADSALRTAEKAEVLLEKRISALDITILRGGGTAVGNWARENGFNLSPDAPEVLDFYAERSPIFMAARFDVARARQRDLSAGDGIPIHLTIPTDRPWVPLRILGLGSPAGQRIEADVFLLTDEAPDLLPVAAPAGSDRGVVLERSEAASVALLEDLRTDKGMSWLPGQGMWLSYLRLDVAAGDLHHDLAISVDGALPSLRDAGLTGAGIPGAPGGDGASPWTWVLAALVAMTVIWGTGRVVERRG